MQELWTSYRGQVLLVVALVITALIGGYATHPGVHLAGATVLLDVLFILQPKLRSPVGTGQWVLLNVMALLVIRYGSDPLELWVTALYGVYALLLIVWSYVNGKAR